VYVLQALTEDDLKQIVAKAQAQQALPAIESGALERLIAYADGDARRLLNTLETVAITAAAEQRSAVDDAWLLKVLGEQLRRYDKGGEQFYDTISALHKSVRGSDPDAALYWLVRMLDGGADPRYLARRLVRMASEDIGLADPRAAPGAGRGRGVRAPGQPRGRAGAGRMRGLSGRGAQEQRGVQGLQRGARLREAGRTRPVPMHLRNAPTKLMKELDYGKGYRYAHDEEGGFAAGERYLPEGMAEPAFYQPVPRGLEIKIGESWPSCAAATAMPASLSHHAGSQKVVSVKENPALNRPGGLHRPDKIAPLFDPYNGLSGIHVRLPEAPTRHPTAIE
jgi:putative ATPase